MPSHHPAIQFRTPRDGALYRTMVARSGGGRVGLGLVARRDLERYYEQMEFGAGRYPPDLLDALLDLIEAAQPLAGINPALAGALRQARATLRYLAPKKESHEQH